jgi:hypothetical protein
MTAIQTMAIASIGAAITTESPTISMAMKTTAQRKKNGSLKRLWGSGSCSPSYMGSHCMSGFCGLIPSFGASTFPQPNQSSDPGDSRNCPGAVAKEHELPYSRTLPSALRRGWTESSDGHVFASRAGVRVVQAIGHVD